LLAFSPQTSAIDIAMHVVLLQCNRRTRNYDDVYQRESNVKYSTWDVIICMQSSFKELWSYLSV